MLDTVNTVKTDTHYWSGQIYYTYNMSMCTRGVVTIITLPAGRPSYRGSFPAGVEIFLVSEASKPDLGQNQPPIH
jgi:hypothetical protein